MYVLTQSTGTLRYSLCFGITFGCLLIIIGTEYLLHGYPQWRKPLLIFGNDSYNNSTQNSPENKSFKILWYAPPFWLSVKSASHKINGCELDNCEVLFNQTKLKDSDLVLFHHADININPPVKRPNQTWVFVSFETPFNTRKYYTKTKWRDKFDWIMSYRSDADGYAPYSKIVPVKITNKRNYTTIFLQKQKDVAWVVSHCHTQSKREKYVEQMKKFINVDIFGECGKPCDGDCFQKLNVQYKFYLSFENSICKDYVTEKVYRMFKNELDIIPVVRGAPNVKELIPKNTFISTSDFKSPKLLAEYLKEIGSDESNYIDILKTKHKYTNTMGVYNLGLCSLCRNLNSSFKRRQKLNLSTVLNIDQCKQPNDI